MKDKSQTPQLTSRMPRYDPEAFGRYTELIARYMATPPFFIIMTIFCAVWLLWNAYAPDDWRFDNANLGYTVLTLVLSILAAYAAPLILLAESRQDDRDRFNIQQDRERAERSMADTEYLTREVIDLRLTIDKLISEQQKNYDAVLKKLEDIQTARTE